jgi:hypothetical protein
LNRFFADGLIALMNGPHQSPARSVFIFFALLVCLENPTLAAVRILRIEGVVRHNVGFVAKPEALTKETILMPGSAISTGKDSFLDLQFVESGTLLRVAAESSLRLQTDTFYIQNGMPSCLISVELNTGQVIALPVFAGDTSRLQITTQQGSCVASGAGSAFEFSAAAKLKCLVGRIARGFVVGQGRAQDRYRIYPPDSPSGEPEPVAAKDIAELQRSIDSLQRNSLIAL